MSSSEAGKAAHTPGIPNTALSTSEQATMATMPRQMEVMEASAGQFGAQIARHHDVEARK